MLDKQVNATLHGTDLTYFREIINISDIVDLLKNDDTYIFRFKFVLY